MTDDDKSRSGRPRHAEETTRPSAPQLEGGTPPPTELTGRASETDDDLTALFESDAAEHFSDGFRGGSNSEPGSDLRKDVDTDPDAGEDVTAV
jgi:hypothetical protein